MSPVLLAGTQTEPPPRAKPETKKKMELAIQARDRHDELRRRRGSSRQRWIMRRWSWPQGGKRWVELWTPVTEKVNCSEDESWRKVWNNRRIRFQRRRRIDVYKQNKLIGSSSFVSLWHVNPSVILKAGMSCSGENLAPFLCWFLFGFYKKRFQPPS